MDSIAAFDYCIEQDSNQVHMYNLKKRVIIIMKGFGVERASNQVHIFNLKNTTIITLKEFYYYPRWCICTRIGLGLQIIIGSGLAIGRNPWIAWTGGQVLQLKGGVYVPEEI